MPAGAGSVRGHVTTAIRALRTDAPLPPRLLAGRACSQCPASSSPQPAAAAAAAARAPGSTMTGMRRAARRRPGTPDSSPRAAPRSPAASLLPPTPAAPPQGSSQQDEDRRKVAGWPQPGVSLPASAAAPPPRGPERPSGPRGRSRGGPPGSAWALRRSPRSCFRLFALPPARTVKGGRAGGAAAAGCVGVGSRLPGGAGSELRSAAGSRGAASHRPRAGTPGRGSREAGTPVASARLPGRPLRRWPPRRAYF